MRDATKPISIVIVEDRADQLALIRAAFAAHPGRYRLITVGSLAEASEQAAQSRPDLVIANLNLPDGRGTDLLPGQEGEPDFPLVIMTNQGDEHIAVETIKAGSLDYVVKTPANLAELPRIAENALRQWQHILDKKNVELSLRASEERYRRLVEDLPALVCRFLPDGTLTFVNEHYCNYFAKTAAELVGENFFNFIPAEEQADVRAHYSSLTPEKPVITYEHQVNAPDGMLRWQRWTDRALFDPRGQPVEYQSIGEDITPRKMMEQRLKEMALHDPLTELPNRRLYNERLEHALAHARRSKERVAVFFMDLDFFKLVNDRYGHDAGDQALKETAKRLIKCVRASDTVARMGGDEFTVLLENFNHPQDTVLVAEKIMAAIRQPYLITRQPLQITVSIGISLFPKDGELPEHLIGAADRAMYQAKDTGRNRICFFNKSPGG